MATGVVAIPAVNGALVPSASDLAEYEKLIKLRDSVISGQHPKLKPLSATSAQDSTKTTTNAQAIASNNAINASFTSGNAAVYGVSSGLPSQLQSNGQLMPAALSGFDPVLLEKSPLLIATEQNISRKNLEGAIAQEVKRRIATWPKLDRENILPEFDVDDILRKAQQQVKPVLIDTEKLAARDRSPAKSDDDQSYYSSQAHDDDNEHPSDSRALNASKPCVYFFKGKCNKGQACKFSHDPAFAAQLKPSAPLTEPDRSYANAGAGGPPPKKQKRDDIRYGHQQGNNSIDPDEDHAANAKRRANEQYQRDLARATQSTYHDANHQDVSHVPTPPSARRLPPQERRFSGRDMTPTRDVHVVRNTIASPLAPQPARVSPLAMKGPAHIEKGRFDGPYGPSPQFVTGRHSPPNNQQVHNRKRRRDTNPQGGPEGPNARRRVASPEIRVKDEPISPKPMNAVPRYVREEAARRPVDLDTYSPQGGRIEQRQVREAPVHYIDEPGFRRVSSPVVRVISRAEPRQELRREPELRRVISERQMVRAESPAMSIREPVYYNDAPRPLPGPPQGPVREVYVTRSDADLHTSYRASVAPNGPPHSEYPADPRRGRSPPALQPAGNMAPPPVRRRIVRDQYGNEYYEQVIAEPPPRIEPPRYSVAPEPRYAGEPTFNGRPSSRIGSVVPEPARQYHEAPVPRRLEPEPTSPRYVDYPPTAPARASSVAPAFQGEYASERPQIVRVNEYPREERYERVVHEAPRATYTERPQQVYYDDTPRDGAYRVQSVRPEAGRYVEKDDRFVRQVSVHPAAAGYERVAHSMAPPGAPAPRYEYADGRGGREYTVAGNGPQYIG